MLEMSLLAEKLLAVQEWGCSIELVIFKYKSRTALIQKQFSKEKIYNIMLKWKPLSRTIKLRTSVTWVAESVVPDV